MAGSGYAIVGSLNRQTPHFEGARGKGLTVFRFDGNTGALDHVCDLADIDNPSYIAVHPTNGCVYVVAEVFGWNEGTVTAYRFDRTHGRLVYLNKQPTLGSITTYVGFDRTGRWALVANYALGDPAALPGQAVAVFGIRPDGTLTPPVSSLRHEGSGPDPARQEQAHPHCVVPTPDNRFVVVADLGLDRLLTYRLDADTGRLGPEPVACFATAPAAGPRHLVFHPEGRLAVLVNELDSTVASLAFDAVSGSFTSLDTVSALPPGFTGANTASGIALSGGGDFIHVANRGHDSIATFALDTASGRLSATGQASVQGRTPRQFAVTSTGRFLLVANQDSDGVVVLARDAATGRLLPTGQRGRVGTPMCVMLVET